MVKLTGLGDGLEKRDMERELADMLLFFNRHFPDLSKNSNLDTRKP